MTYLLKLLSSSTMLFAITLAALSVAQGYTGLPPITLANQMFVGILISVIITVLRIAATQPIDDK